MLKSDQVPFFILHSYISFSFIIQYKRWGYATQLSKIIPERNVPNPEGKGKTLQCATATALKFMHITWGAENAFVSLPLPKH